MKSENEDLKSLRIRIKEQRRKEWIRDAQRLRNRTPEESLRTMFDLIRFAEKVKRAEKCEP